MEKIREILTGIAQTKSVKILYACETGSRAWGFPSPDSDFDIRFIYMHERDWYLSLSQRKDTVEYMEGDWDITGWDLKKCLGLLKKSNVPLIERFQSPIEYYARDGFKNDFKLLIENYYSPTAVFFHHFSLAKKFWNEIDGRGEYKLKSFFYLVRSLLSCNWILHDKKVLPMHIEGLMKYVDEQTAVKFRDLIRLKATVGEKYLHKADEGMSDWVKRNLEMLGYSSKNIGVSNSNMNMLNEFFLKMINEKVDN